MPEIEIRPATASDIPELIKLDHTITTDNVWQLELKENRERSQVAVQFQKVRLPRAVRYDYPKPVRSMIQDWQTSSGFLVATLADRIAGYTRLVLDRIPKSIWVTDLVVEQRVRRQGIGSGLLLAAAEFGRENECRRLIMEMHPRNTPAIALATKMGFDFCGFIENYYPMNEVGIFFRKSI